MLGTLMKKKSTISNQVQSGELYMSSELAGRLDPDNPFGPDEDPVPKIARGVPARVKINGIDPLEGVLQEWSLHGLERRITMVLSGKVGPPALLAEDVESLEVAGEPVTIQNWGDWRIRWVWENDYCSLIIEYGKRDQ